MPLTEQTADKGSRWQGLARRYSLVHTAYDQVSGYPFVDAVLASDLDMVQSTIKIRLAGFFGCVDTHASAPVP